MRISDWSSDVCSSDLGNRFWFTAILALSTTLFTYIVAFPIGIYSAVRQYSAGDYAATFFGYFGLAMPNFLFALILMHYLNIWFGLSIGGMLAPQYIGTPWSDGMGNTDERRVGAEGERRSKFRE